MSIFKVEAMGDVMYIEAENLINAEQRLFTACGPIPAELLTWHYDVELPDGEVLL